MIDQVAGFNLPPSPNPLLHRVLVSALPEARCDGSDRPSEPYWDAAFFQLHQVTLFQDAKDEERAAMLDRASHSLLKEAYWIEKAGVGYMAKMVLLAETQEERMLYGLFTADETIHLGQLRPFVLHPDCLVDHNPFLKLLSDVVEGTDKSLLLFVLQVVLEGWGLSHYRRLSQTCRDRALSDLFSSFLQAEARHHATGSLLFNQTAIAAASQGDIIDVLATFLHMVQLGPQSVLAAIEQVKGHLSRSQKIQILEELDTVSHSGTRLQLLRSLMHGETAAAIVATLEAQGAFDPLQPHQCV